MRNTILTVVLCGSTLVHAQNDRINTRGTTGWYNTLGTFKLSDTWGIHTEYQWRRDSQGGDGQQCVLHGEDALHGFSFLLHFAAPFSWRGLGALGRNQRLKKIDVAPGSVVVWAIYHSGTTP